MSLLVGAAGAGAGLDVLLLGVDNDGTGTVLLDDEKVDIFGEEITEVTAVAVAALEELVTGALLVPPIALDVVVDVYRLRHADE